MSDDRTIADGTMRTNPDNGPEDNGPEDNGPEPQQLTGRFGRYDVLRLLGVGGMGCVYLATDRVLRRNVALKVPHLHAADDPLLMKRFFREAELAARIQHPNIFSLYDMGSVDNVHYIAMAYIDGPTLQERLATGQPMDPAEAGKLIAEVAMAMAEVHDAGVIHRDLKPANIMIDKSGRPIVTDFGLAFPLASESRLTLDGTVLGTPTYLPREQLEGGDEANQPFCDIYSLGVILYQLLTGGHLPYGGNEQETLSNLLAGAAPVPPTFHRSDLHTDLETICLQAIAPTVDQRFVSMRNFAAALEGFLDQQ